MLSNLVVRSASSEEHRRRFLCELEARLTATPLEAIVLAHPKLDEH